MKKMGTGLLMVALLTGCIGDEFNTDRLSNEIDLTSGVAVPLAKASVTMGDILSEDTDFVKYYKDQDGNERIMLYQESDSANYVGLNDFFSISSQAVSVPVDYNIFRILPEISGQWTLPLSVPNAQISTVELDYDLTLTTSNLYEPLILTLEFPTANSATGGKTITVELSGDQTYSYSYTGDRIDLASNEIPVNITVRPVSGTSFSTHTGYITIELDNFNITYVKGTMSETVIDIDNERYDLDFDVLNEFPDGIEFDDPRLKLLINNSTPFNGLFQAAVEGQLDNNQSIALTLPPAIDMRPCPVGVSSVHDTIVIDKTNSNLKDFLYELPQQFTYGGSLLLNPDNTISDVVEMDDNSRIYTGYVIEVPLEVIVDATMDIDTVDVDANDFLKDLLKAKLVFNSSNGFPFEADAFIEFYQDGVEQATEIINATVIAPAKVNAQGVVTEKADHSQEIELSSEQLNKLSEANKLLLKLRLRSSNYDQNQPVVVFTNNELSVSILLRGQVKL